MDEEEVATQAMNDAIGPFYDCAGLQKWLDLTEDDVLELERQGHLLAVRPLDGDLLFPTYQFGPGGALLPSLDEVLKVLRRWLSDWGTAAWMVNEDRQDGMSKLERLRSGDGERVIRDATRLAEILSH